MLHAEDGSARRSKTRFRPLAFILGRRLANREYNERKIGAFEGVPAMGLDGVGSSAYGPEAALTVLMPLGAASIAYIGWVMAPIVLMLAILFASYWQTIRAYPNNGGAYIVSRENLGVNASLLAAAALMIDYVLNVAVGISAGVAALVSVYPSLHPHILPLCLGILALVTIANLRGTLDAGRLFALPTYAFVASFGMIIAFGARSALLNGGHAQPVVPPPAPPAATEAVTLWLLLRAFASGCTAMTGVEAVSNGMSAFREPRVRFGHRTLSAIVIILGLLLVSIAWLATSYGIAAMDQTRAGYRSVLSQLASAAVGNGVLYYIGMNSLLCVLALSANTSFVDFPRLCRIVAEDGFLPKPFAIAGRRLVFSAGILYLACMAGVLLFVFGGITDRLIPLFAIGAFMTFTLSQLGMVVHWRRVIGSADAPGERRAHRAHLWINGTGAAMTAAALVVMVLAKFEEGAWITLLIVPCVIALLRRIRHYYDALYAEVSDPGPFELRDTAPPVVLVTVEGWNRLTEKALRLAATLSPDVIAVHLSELSGPEAEEHDRSLRALWKRDVEDPAAAAGLRPPRLMILQAPYRAIHEPILKLVQQLELPFAGRRIAVLIPEVTKKRWYQYFLHAHRARDLRSQLLRYGGSKLTVINVPWHLDDIDRNERLRGEAP